jgi:hypothetical protein
VVGLHFPQNAKYLFCFPDFVHSNSQRERFRSFIININKIHEPLYVCTLANVRMCGCMYM